MPPPQHSLSIATQRSSILLSGPATAIPYNRGSSSSSRCQQLSSSSGSCKPTVSASFGSHRRNQQCIIAHSLQTCGFFGEPTSSKRCWVQQQQQQQQQLNPKGLTGLLLGKQQQLWRRPHSQADTEADSLEDLNIDDMNEEELDDLFETYGEVVERDSKPKPASVEADDDTESLQLAVALAEVANEVKAEEIRVLCVKPLVYWTRFFVIATGFSKPQVDAMGTRMRNMAEERFKRTPRGDLKPNAWTLLDFGDVVVHIFYPKERSFYNIEEFYGNALPVELPF